MDDSDDGKNLESRPPTVEDLVKLCRSLNNMGAKYLVIGGMAVIQAGFVRATADIDLLVDAAPENQVWARDNQDFFVLYMIIKILC